MEPPSGTKADAGPLRTLWMLAIGAAPAAISYGLLALGESTGKTLLNISGFVMFGFLTPIVVANAKRRGSVVVAMLLAAAFLGFGGSIRDEGYNLLPWWLFAWGLFPSLAITLSIRLSSVKLLPFTLPFALLASVVARLLVPDSILAAAGIVLLLADMLILRQFGKMASEAPPADP